jgi:hypothetical protein
MINIDLEPVITRLEKGEKVDFTDLLQLLPEALHPSVEVIKRRAGCSDANAIYLISTIAFYSPCVKALYVIQQTIPSWGDWHKHFDFKSFFINQKKAYSKRCRNLLPHDPAILRFEFDFSPTMWTICSSRTLPPLSNDDGPSWQNSIRQIEDE